MSYSYDDQNIFAKILRGEIPNKTVLETEHSLAFHDIEPQAPVHVLIIPKGPYVNYDHFTQTASAEEIADFFKTISQVAAQLDLRPSEGGKGYRIIANAGEDANQEVLHLHMHLVAGRFLERILV